MMAKQAQKIVDDSWEERAFAEDTAGMLGGCVWPPRSYTCSFCGREFRSAQALGGHMNIHRRDRAKLKQLSCSPNDQILNPHRIDCYNNRFHSYSSLTFSYPTSHQNQDSCSFFCNNPNAVSNQQVLSQELNGSSKQSLNLHVPPLVLNHKRKPSFSTYNLEISSKNKATDCKNENYPEKPSLTVSLINFRKYRPTSGARYDEEDGSNNGKRRKVDVPSQPGMSKPNRDKVDYHLSKVDTLKSNSLEELDLELRLGVKPKIQ